MVNFTTTVLVIGAGPSGLTVGAALHGLTPYLLKAPFFNMPVKELCDRINPSIEKQRSKNPLTVTFDNLKESGHITFEWTDRKIGHLILTNGEAGGLWNELDPLQECLSPAKWMELPGGKPWNESRRPSMREVSLYYKDYALQFGAAIHAHTMVTTAKRVNDFWHVEAQRQGQVVTYKAQDLVLATGSYSVPIHLGIPGEAQRFVSHRIPHTFEPGKVLIVGSGFSAADCVLKAIESGCVVHHIFHNQGERAFINRELNETFPKHEKLKSWMRGEKQHPNYVPHLDGQLTKIAPDGCIINQTCINFDQVVILVGSRPNLSFIECGDVERDIDKYTYQVKQGLYAVGPLTGDNFVKMNIAGCFAAADTILKKYH